MANPTGKGGFKDHPELINKEGAPTKNKSWGGAVARLTNMTREELIAYVGAKSKMGRLLRELPPNIPVKDALVLISIIQYGRDPSPGMFNALADREDGKPNQPLTGGDGGAIEHVVRFIDDTGNNNPAPEAAPSAGED
jgi:hypothetical protein